MNQNYNEYSFELLRWTQMTNQIRNMKKQKM